MDKEIKQCPKCGLRFTLRDILENRDIIPIGMASDDNDPELNFYYFNHESVSCKTTFTVPLSAFEQIINEDIPEHILMGTDCCEEHCSSIEDLSLCSQECRYAPYRRLLLSMIEKKKLLLQTEKFNC